MGQPHRNGFRRGDRGRVRHPHHDEHAGRDRDRRPARRRGRAAEERGMTEALRTPMDPADAPLPEGGGRDLFSKFDALIAEREALLDSGVRDPFGLVMEKVLSPTPAIVNGKEKILLGSYNYMGMTFDPDVVAAGKKALDEFGSGTTGSRVLNGTYQGHKEVEAALRDFYGTRHAIVFSTGYQANLGMISTLAAKGEYVIIDA